MRFATTALFLLAAFAVESGSAWAQSRTGGAQGFSGASASARGGSAAAGSQGLFGNRNIGSSLSAGTRGFSGAGVNNGRGVAGATSQDNGAGILQGNERFVRGSRQPGAFVGSDTTDLPSFLTNLATAGGRGQSGLNAQGNRNRNQGNANQDFQNFGGRNGRQQQPRYRTTRIVAFDVPTPSPTELSTRLTQRFLKTPGIESVSPVQVVVQQRTAILRGVVATDHDRDLAERLVLLEAGISRVQNELRVAQPLPGPEAQSQR